MATSNIDIDKIKSIGMIKGTVDDNSVYENKNLFNNVQNKIEEKIENSIKWNLLVGKIDNKNNDEISNKLKEYQDKLEKLNSSENSLLYDLHSLLVRMTSQEKLEKYRSVLKRFAVNGRNEQLEKILDQDEVNLIKEYNDKLLNIAINAFRMNIDEMKTEKDKFIEEYNKIDSANSVTRSLLEDEIKLIDLNISIKRIFENEGIKTEENVKNYVDKYLHEKTMYKENLEYSNKKKEIDGIKKKIEDIDNNLSKNAINLSDGISGLIYYIEYHKELDEDVKAVLKWATLSKENFEILKEYGENFGIKRNNITYLMPPNTEQTNLLKLAYWDKYIKEDLSKNKDSNEIIKTTNEININVSINEYFELLKSGNNNKKELDEKLNNIHNLTTLAIITELHDNDNIRNVINSTRADLKEVLNSLYNLPVNFKITDEIKLNVRLISYAYIDWLYKNNINNSQKIKIDENKIVNNEQEQLSNNKAIENKTNEQNSADAIPLSKHIRQDTKKKIDEKMEKINSLIQAIKDEKAKKHIGNTQKDAIKVFKEQLKNAKNDLKELNKEYKKELKDEKRAKREQNKDEKINNLRNFIVSKMDEILDKIRGKEPHKIKVENGKAPKQ